MRQFCQLGHVAVVVKNREAEIRCEHCGESVQFPQGTVIGTFFLVVDAFEKRHGHEPKMELADLADAFDASPTP